MKQVYTFLFAILCCGLQAQQVGMYNHYFFKPFVYNPAFAGQGNDAQVMMLSHSQWVGYNGGPQSHMLTADGAITEDKASVGLVLLNERRGIFQRTGGSAAYSYRLKINDDAYFALGLALGAVNQTIDYTKAVAENWNDPTLFSGAQQKTTLDANAGIAFGWKGLQFGFSMPQALGNKMNYVDDSTTRTSYAQARHYMASLGYKINVLEEKGISVTPQALVRIVPNAPFQFDGNLNFAWQNKFWVGATYKSNYAIAVNAGITIHKKLSVGYSYDVITGAIGAYSGISHEIMVNYRFGSKKETEIPKEEPAPETTQVAANASRVDSLQEELDNNKERVKQLKARLDEQAKAQQEMQAQIAALQNNQANQVTNNVSNSGNENIGTNVPIVSGNPSSQSKGKTNTSGGNKNPAPNKTSGNQEAGKNDQSQNSYSKDPANASGLALKQHDKKELEKNIEIATDDVNSFKNTSGVGAKPGYYLVVGTFFYRDFANAELQRFLNRGYAGTSLIFSEPRQFNYIYTERIGSQQDAVIKVKEIKSKGYTDAWILQLK